MATILAKESASQEGEENLTWVVDPKRMEGAVRMMVSRQVWSSARLSQALNQEGVNGPERRYRGWCADKCCKKQTLQHLPISMV